MFFCWRRKSVYKTDSMTNYVHANSLWTTTGRYNQSSIFKWSVVGDLPRSPLPYPLSISRLFCTWSTSRMRSIRKSPQIWSYTRVRWSSIHFSRSSKHTSLGPYAQKGPFKCWLSLAVGQLRFTPYKPSKLILLVYGTKRKITKTHWGAFEHVKDPEDMFSLWQAIT